MWAGARVDTDATVGNAACAAYTRCGDRVSVCLCISPHTTEISFEEFLAATRHLQGDFAALVSAATHPADVARSLEEANTRFLATFNEFVCQTLASCQAEVLAAKVPLASYGRVKSALDTVASELTETAQQLLSTEFAQLRSSAISSMQALKAQLDATAEASQATAVEVATREADARAAELEARVGEMEAEVRAASTGSRAEPTVALPMCHAPRAAHSMLPACGLCCGLLWPGRAPTCDWPPEDSLRTNLVR